MLELKYNTYSFKIITSIWWIAIKYWQQFINFYKWVDAKLADTSLPLSILGLQVSTTYKSDSHQMKADTEIFKTQAQTAKIGADSSKTGAYSAKTQAQEAKTQAISQAGTATTQLVTQAGTVSITRT